MQRSALIGPPAAVSIVVKLIGNLHHSVLHFGTSLVISRVLQIVQLSNISIVCVALSSPQKDSAAVASSNWHPLGEARVPVRSEAIAYGGPLISTSTAQNSLWQQARGPSFSSGHVNGESVIPTGIAPTLGPCPGFEANAKPSTAERSTTNVKKPANNQHHVATTSAGRSCVWLSCFYSIQF